MGYSFDQEGSLKKLINILGSHGWKLLIFLVLLVGLWQVAFFQNIMRWDAMDITLPWRYFISECINNNVLPLWNPYINLGFPQMGDARTWYPISWALSLFFGCNAKILQIDFLLHLLIGGLGFFRFSQSKKLGVEIAFILSICYMLSGFFIGNAQHLGWIRSGAWLPFIFLFYEKFSHSFKLRDGILLSMVLFFLLSGGYEAYFITCCYIIFFVAGFKIIKNFRSLRASARLNIKPIVITILFFLGLSGIVLHSTFELSNYITRGKPLDFSNEGWGVLTGSLTPKSLISFVLPFGTSIDPEYWGNDISMINSYMGIVPFTFALYGILKFKKEALPYLITGLFFLALALAEVFPFRKWLYLYLPYMDIFRFSTLFRLYAIMFLLVGAGISLKDFSLKKTLKKDVKFLWAWSILSAFVLCVFLSNWWTFDNTAFITLWDNGFLEYLEESNKNNRLLLNSFFALFLLGFMLWSFLKFSGRKLIISLLIITIFDMVITTQLNLYNTVVDGKVSPIMVDQGIDKLPKGFPVPSLQIPMKDLQKDELTLPYLWRNLGILYKSPNISGYTPYTLNGFEAAHKDSLVDIMSSKPFLFKADFPNKNQLILNKNNFTSITGIEIKNFNPNKITCSVFSEKSTHLVLSQCDYPHWKVFVNYKEVDKKLINKAFMGVEIFKGENQVTFIYAPPATKKLFVLSWVCLFFGVIVIVKYQFLNFKI